MIEWRHEQDDPNAPGILGECFAEEVADHGWYVVWSGYSRDWLGGGSWTVDLACFTARDTAAVAILEWVSARRAPCWPSSPWAGACDLAPFKRMVVA